MLWIHPFWKLLSLHFYTFTLIKLPSVTRDTNFNPKLVGNVLSKISGKSFKTWLRKQLN